MELWDDELGGVEAWLALLIIIMVAMAVSVAMPWLMAWNIILIVFKINMIVVQWHSAGLDVEVGHDDDVDCLHCGVGRPS